MLPTELASATWPWSITKINCDDVSTSSADESPLFCALLCTKSTLDRSENDWASDCAIPVWLLIIIKQSSISRWAWVDECQSFERNYIIWLSPCIHLASVESLSEVSRTRFTTFNGFAYKLLLFLSRKGFFFEENMPTRSVKLLSSPSLDAFEKVKKQPTDDRLKLNHGWGAFN